MRLAIAFSFLSFPVLLDSTVEEFFHIFFDLLLLLFSNLRRVLNTLVLVVGINQLLRDLSKFISLAQRGDDAISIYLFCETFQVVLG